jgi:NAD(P)-dependent dehydrogenase (short-subunit alcohol dehydrogenase family)
VLAGDRALLSDLDPELRRALLTAAGRVSRPTRDQQRLLQRALRKRDRTAERAHDAALVASTRNRATRRRPDHVLAASAPLGGPEQPGPGAELKRARACYVCKAAYRRLHSFYDSLCPTCAALNWDKRHQRCDLAGKVALVTGARIKIGYQATLMLLRAGATVIATTRFPRDAATRYSREADFPAFADRLSVYGIDLRHIPSVERLAARLVTSLPRLDIIINNAAQTVRRPPAYYHALCEKESSPPGELPASARALLLPGGILAAREVAPAHLSQLALTDEDLAGAADFPAGALDLDAQQLDLRTRNSWRLRAHEVSSVELLEVHLVNAVAPFLLCSRLRPLLERSPDAERHIVNVSAMEASFSRRKKTDKHPHTNMAKAALNMLTRTSAADYARSRIYMNSVDTGWITDEYPLPDVERKQRVHDFHPPLDAIDGAARVCDPVFRGFGHGDHLYGLFWKDYRPVPW